MDVGRHPNIELLAYSEVEDVSGYVGNFKVRIRKRARLLTRNSVLHAETARLCVRS